MKTSRDMMSLELSLMRGILTVENTDYVAENRPQIVWKNEWIIKMIISLFETVYDRVNDIIHC